MARASKAQGISRRIRVLAVLAGLLAALPGGRAAAAEPAACRAVRFAEVGWTDIAATTALASRLFEGLGYRPETRLVTVPGAYAAMRAKRVDVFLGNWMPSMAADRQPFVDDGSVEVVGANLEGAKFTLAVPVELYGAGLRTFADIARFREPLQGRIYGIEPGNDGNRLILEMIRTDMFGLSGFQLVETSERGMLAHVEQATQRGQPIVFLGWEPHPMNVMFRLRYLDGGDAVFGPNFGGATVYTNVRAGYLRECPNAGRLVRNLRFTLGLENTLMRMILFYGMDPAQAAEQWLRANAPVWTPWLEGVAAFDGRPGPDAVKAGLGLR
ncbi:MAG TPA: choline ABC transporter substrate-binding protein [Microvirga sp.]|jgi:glycine betaine/proline transport system substrate-binding protein|nr:choline ABC transporter substrate-binding protein [Microvirga sp.]